MKRIWFHKGLVTDKHAVSVDDRGLTLGDGVFETIAVRNGVAMWRFEHIERLRNSATELGIPFPEEDVENAIDTLTYATKSTHVLRLSLTRGEGGRGLAGDVTKPNLIGTLMPFDEALRFQPLSLITSTVRRNMHSPSSRLKTLSYVDNILAAREAHALGADDALMLNSMGRLSCCSIGNVFLEYDGILVTPSLSEAILPGIMRGVVITLAKHAGVVVKEKQVKAADVAKADGMFMTNSLRMVRNVARCDKMRFTARSKVLDTIVRGLLDAEHQQIILN